VEHAGEELVLTGLVAEREAQLVLLDQLSPDQPGPPPSSLSAPGQPPAAGTIVTFTCFMIG
ncbi:hypothetical protein ABT140_32735, partial [Streptomyces californicus]|uniref:hypothetical protein n=1 Tax=Streptomyces californicus TaxID=67351 RepID=UPI003316E006